MHFEQSVVSLLKSTVLAEFKKWRHMPCIREFNLPSFQSAHKVLPFLNLVQMCHQSCESFSYSYPKQVGWQQTLLMDVLLWWSFLIFLFIVSDDRLNYLSNPETIALGYFIWCLFQTQSNLVSSVCSLLVCQISQILRSVVHYPSPSPASFMPVDLFGVSSW